MFLRQASAVRVDQQSAGTVAVRDRIGIAYELARRSYPPCRLGGVAGTGRSKVRGVRLLLLRLLVVRRLLLLVAGLVLRGELLVLHLVLVGHVAPLLAQELAELACGGSVLGESGAKSVVVGGVVQRQL